MMKNENKTKEKMPKGSPPGRVPFFVGPKKGTKKRAF
jgi:hypothetical protein